MTLHSRPNRSRRAGLRLGAVQSVEELVSNGASGVGSVNRGVKRIGASVNTSDTLGLLVVYRVAGSDPNRIISVVGRPAMSGSPNPTHQGPIEGATVNINTSGTSSEAAMDALRAYESRMRTAAGNVGIRPSSIQLMDAGF